MPPDLHGAASCYNRQRLALAVVDVFLSFSHQDESLRDELLTHLSAMKRQGLIRGWDDRKIGPGEDWQGQIAEHLDTAGIVLLLVSASFIASDYCWDVEVARALRRRATGGATVIPILLRACDWENTPLSALQALPADARPITSWSDRDEAWKSVISGLRRAIESPDDGRPDIQPQPHFGTPQNARLSTELDAAYKALEDAAVAGVDTIGLHARIVAIRRELREGGRLEAGDYLGGNRYKLINIIGSGGFADVWRAYDKVRHRVVAVKTLHGDHSRDQSRVERFFRGAREMASLRHPAIVQVLDPYGKDGQWCFFVMEYIEGGDLREAVLGKALPRNSVVPIICAVGEALSHAHERRLIHRDVSPANVLLAGAAPVLTDFDLVRTLDSTGGTRTGAMGKFVYAAPETLDRPQDADGRADVYGLAMTALFALSGRELEYSVVRDAGAHVAALDCKAMLKKVLSAGLEWRLGERISTMSEFVALLRLANSETDVPHSGVNVHGSGVRVLVVDDQRNMRVTIAMILQQVGYEVDQAASGPEASDLVRERWFDVVLTDLRMGELDGIDVLKMVKEARPSTQVIVMTAYGTIESAVVAMRMGAFDYIQKPFTENELLERLAHADDARRVFAFRK